MPALMGVQGDILVTSPPSVALTDSTCSNPSSDKKTWSISNAVKRILDTTSVPIVQTELDEIQTVALTGAPTGGTFTLTFGGQTTAGIAWNAAASAVQSALQALSSIGAGNALVTGGPGPSTAWVVEFAASLGFANQATMTFSGAGLTGGSSPNVTVTVTQNGQGWTVVSASNYSLQYIGAIITFNVALVGANIGVRFHTGSGAYFPYASIGNTTDWQANYSYKFQDGTTHKGVGGESWADFYPLVGGGTITLKKWWIDQTFLNFMSNNTLLVLNLLTADGHYTGAYCYVKDSSLKDPPAGLIEGALTFQITGQIVYV